MSKKQPDDDLVEETMDAQTDSEETEEIDASPSNGDKEADNDREDTEKQLAVAKQEVIDVKDKMLRLAADYENYKKRNERERATAMKYAGEHIFREFLPVVDNLERAVQQGMIGDNDSEAKLASLLEGVELTLERLYKSLDKFEVKPFESKGVPFDPNKQEAMTMEPSESVPENHVVQEYEKGYFYKDRLLRAAKVTVSSGKAE